MSWRASTTGSADLPTQHVRRVGAVRVPLSRRRIVRVISMAVAAWSAKWHEVARDGAVSEPVVTSAVSQRRASVREGLRAGWSHGPGHVRRGRHGTAAHMGIHPWLGVVVSPDVPVWHPHLAWRRMGQLRLVRTTHQFHRPAGMHGRYRRRGARPFVCRPRCGLLVRRVALDVFTTCPSL